MAVDGVVDLAGLDAGTGQRLAGGNGAQFMGGEPGQAAAEAADGGARAAENDDGIEPHGVLLSS